MNTKKRPGRPTLAANIKKQPVNFKLSPWVNSWLNDQSPSKASLIEKAIIEHYELEKPDNL